MNGLKRERWIQAEREACGLSALVEVRDCLKLGGGQMRASGFKWNGLAQGTTQTSESIRTGVPVWRFPGFTKARENPHTVE